MNYYKVGSTGEIVVSNSSLSHINPEQGGHPRKFLDFFRDGKEYEYSKSLELGRAIHSYIEDPNNFAIADFTMPSSEMKIKLIHLCHENGFKDFTMYDRDKYDQFATEAGYKKIPNPDSNDEAFLKHLIEGETKIALDRASADRLYNMKRSISENFSVYNQLFGDVKGVDKHYKEVAIYFSIPTTIMGENGEDKKVMVPCKALIDDLKINTEYQLYIIDDLKSTRKSIYKFPLSFEEWNYHRQFGFYDIAVRMALMGAAKIRTRDGEPINDFPTFNPNQFKVKGSWNVIPIENNNYFLCTIYAIKPYWIQRGIGEMTKLFKRVAWHLDRDKWETSKEEYNGKGVLMLNEPDVDYRALRESIKNKSY